ncbi:MAG: IS30 family transposase, partial [Nitrospira sp.]
LGGAVVKVDDYTVKIKQSVANRLFLTVMSIYATYPYDSKEMKKHATAEDPWTHDYVNTQNVPSFGAYCLERWVKDDEFVLRANPNYGYKAEQMRDALAAKIKTLPEALRHSLTWDQGIEMQDWKTVKIEAGIDIYFCDPYSPWQRGINENTNGLLRQYFPKGTDLRIHSATDLDWVAQELNDRPRKRLEFRKPIELIEGLLLQ